jgi:hypothetical protein
LVVVSQACPHCSDPLDNIPLPHADRSIAEWRFLILSQASMAFWEQAESPVLAYSKAFEPQPARL